RRRYQEIWIPERSDARSCTHGGWLRVSSGDVIEFVHDGHFAIRERNAARRPEEARRAVSKDGPKRDSATGHPSRRPRFARAPQDEVRGIEFHPTDRSDSWDRSSGRRALQQAVL